MTEELPNCPFCGNQVTKELVPEYDVNAGCDRMILRVFCTDAECDNAMRIYSIKSWQSRPIEDALRSTIAEKDAEIERMKSENIRLTQAAILTNRKLDQLVGTE